MKARHGNPRIVIIQRVVPHYRIPLFRRLYELWGWTVACSGHSTSHSGLNVASMEPFMRPFDFRFVSPKKEYRTIVPTAKVLKATRPDGVIAEFSLQMTSTWSLALMRLFGCGPKVLFWSHGWNMERDPESLVGRFLAKVRILLCKMVDGHVCYSEEGKAHLDEYLKSETVFVARNTIDIARIRRVASKHEPRRDLNHPCLLSVGRFTADKNFPLLVRSFIDFKKHYPGATLVLIGEGDDYSAIIEAAGDYAEASVVLPGALYDESDLAPYFLAADLFVVPGAAGLAVNHALAYSLPVAVFYNVNKKCPRHHPEVTYVKENVTGWRVESYSEAGLTKFLRNLFSETDSPKEKLRTNLDQYVENYLTLDHMIADFERIRHYFARS